MLSYANQHRPSELFDEKECIIRCHGTTKGPPEELGAQGRDHPPLGHRNLGEVSAPLKKGRGMGRQE